MKKGSNDQPDQGERGQELAELIELPNCTPNLRSWISKELHSSLRNYGMFAVS